jgi:hypothetical protein
MSMLVELSSTISIQTPGDKFVIAGLTRCKIEVKPTKGISGLKKNSRD